MFGCLRRLGCLVVLAIVACAAWLTRDRWLPRVTGHTSTQQVVRWEPVTPAGVIRARTSVESLGKKSGPVFVNVSPADLLALFLDGARQQLPPSVADPQASVSGNEVTLRARVSLDDLKGVNLPPFISGRQMVSLSGTVEIVHSGLAQFRVASASIGELPIPHQAVPKLLASLLRGERSADVASDGVPFAVPTSIADVRVARGQVTLYKNLQ